MDVRSAGVTKRQAAPLALKRELREISIAFLNQERALAAKLQDFENTTKAIVQLEQDLDALRVLQQNREKDALALGHEIRKLTEETSRANSRVFLVSPGSGTIRP